MKNEWVTKVMGLSLALVPGMQLLSYFVIGLFRRMMFVGLASGHSPFMPVSHRHPGDERPFKADHEPGLLCGVSPHGSSCLMKPPEYSG